MDNESFWLLDVDDDTYNKGSRFDKTLSNMSSPEVLSTCYESSFESNQGYECDLSRSSSGSKDYRSSSNESLGPFVDDTSLEVSDDIVVPISSKNTIMGNVSKSAGAGGSIKRSSSLIGIGNTPSKSGSNTLLGFGNRTARTTGNNSPQKRNYAPPDADIMNYSDYKSYVNELNNDIEQFSKIIQTLGLFKYYVKNKKNSINISELNKRFNAICVSCSDKIRQIETKLSNINYCNHYIMANEKNLEYLRSRFNLQDSAVKKLKILIDTFNTVVREYTHISKKLLVQSDVATIRNEKKGSVRNVGAISSVITGIGAVSDNTATKMGGEGGTVSGLTGQNVAGDGKNISVNCSSVLNSEIVNDELSDIEKKSLLNEINNRTKDIQILEQNARDLNELFAELNSIIKKRGDNISSLENQILLSSEQIDKGADYIEFIMESDRNKKTLYAVAGSVALLVVLLVIPSNLKNIVFKKFRH